MHRSKVTSAVFFFVAAALTAGATAADPMGVYHVGVAAQDITPNYPIRLNGFGFRRTESEGVTQRIWAKALAIGSDEQKPLVLVTVDNLGARLQMVEDVSRRLHAKAGIEPARFAVCFSHSHTAPKVNGASDTIFSEPIPPEHQKQIDRYTTELSDVLEKVALAALAARKPSKMEWAVGNVKFAMNRRTPGGPVDHRLPMLVVRTVDDNAIRAIYVTYACHCVTLSNNKISGDWAGFAQEAIERQNPGATALVSIGCGSDSNPSSGVTGDNTAAAAEQGGEIAAEVARLLKGPLEPVTGGAQATLANIKLPLNKVPTREELEKEAASGSPNAYNASYQIAKLDRGEPLQTHVDYRIQTWSFGDSLAMVFLAGEVCVDYSLRLQQELDPSRTWLHGYANDFCCYIPSERLLKEGGYGGGAEINYFALPATLHSGLEDKIIAEVRRQVPTAYHHQYAVKVSGPAGDILKLVEDTAVGTPAEYERIPDIWRVAIEAGKQNDADELRKILQVSVPQMDESAADWQVVVVGGGIINGLSLEGVWPRTRIQQLLQDDDDLAKRWDRLIELSAAMADNDAVRSGTRYDALRILGVDDFENRGEQLKKYLTDNDAELQMGAISGLSDMESDDVAPALLASFSDYTESNRKLAIDALLRTAQRRALLLKAVESGQVSPAMLTPEQVVKLREP
jgi:hypothetical protein